MSGLPVIRSRYRAKAARSGPAAAVYLAVPIILGAALAAHLRGAVAGIVPRGRPAFRPSAAFVRLAPEQASAAMARVRTAWQLERGGPGPVDFDPAEAAFELAERPAAPVTIDRPRMPPPRMPSRIPGAEAEHALLPPSVAAPPPAQLDADLAPLAAETLFPRAELLRFDGLSPFRKGTRR